jgi:NTE family protein
MTTPRIGLALGGGSARGLAHIPILEVFDELGLKPSVICGCSIGALIGAGYAAGQPAREIRERAERLLSTRFDTMRYVFGHKRTRLRDIFSLRSISSLHIKGEKLVHLAMPDGMPAHIEDLQIPFKIVATDFDARVERVFEKGPLVPALAASIAIPGVIVSPLIGERIYVDGGITNPVPFDHVRKGTDIVVAVDVTGVARPPVRAHHTNRELAVGSLFIMFHQVAELRRTLSPPDIYIEPAVRGFKGNDFFRLQELFEASQAAKDQLKRELEKRLRRIA